MNKKDEPLVKLAIGKMLPLKLQGKMIILILSLLLLVTVVGGLFSLRIISTILENQIGKRALKVSQTVALIPEIREDIEKGDFSKSQIQYLAEKIRKATGAEFVVVGDREGRRFSHPVKERLGKLMVGGDNSMALEKGQSYVSVAVGTLGQSIRGKVPIFNDQGEVIGIVSVGYLMNNVNTTIKKYHKKILLVLAGVFLLGIFFTVKITNDLKKALFNLEPVEIGTLLQEKIATLEAIREAVIAIDRNGCITTINRAAFRTLGIPKDPHVIGKHIQEVVPQNRMLDVLESGESQLDKVLNLEEKEIIVNRIPIIIKDKVAGVVSSFRDKSELDTLAKKLSQVQEYSAMLRTQTHEYSNKLHTISGLIQIGAYQEAIDLIGSETSGYQDLINSLMSIVSDPVIAGTILGKYNKAKELKVEMSVDPDSSMNDIPENIERNNLVTIIGNILDNGFEAVVKNSLKEKMVKLAMTDLGNDLIFEFDDSGEGIDPELWQKVFLKGYTTKKQTGHGMGLYLVEKKVKQMGGSINVGRSDLGGAAVTVIIPKQIEG